MTWSAAGGGETGRSTTDTCTLRRTKALLLSETVTVRLKGPAAGGVHERAKFAGVGCGPLVARTVEPLSTCAVSVSPVLGSFAATLNVTVEPGAGCVGVGCTDTMLGGTFEPGASTVKLTDA